MTTEQTDEEALDIKKLVQVAVVSSEPLVDLTNLEKVFVFGAMAWAMFRDNAQMFLDATKAMVPEINKLSNSEQKE